MVSLQKYFEIHLKPINDSYIVFAYKLFIMNPRTKVRIQSAIDHVDIEEIQRILSFADVMQLLKTLISYNGQLGGMVYWIRRQRLLKMNGRALY